MYVYSAIDNAARQRGTFLLLFNKPKAFSSLATGTLWCRATEMNIKEKDDHIIDQIHIQVTGVRWSIDN